MTKEGIYKSFGVLKLTYPNQFNHSSVELESLEKIWNIQFRNNTDKEIAVAIQQLVSVSRFIPTISDIKKMIYETNNEVMNAEKAWSIVLKAGSNSLYHANEEYNNLPFSIRKSITVDMLYEIAKSDTYELHFIKKDFITAYSMTTENDKIGSLVNTVSLNISQIDGNKAITLISDDEDDGNCGTNNELTMKDSKNSDE